MSVDVCGRCGAVVQSKATRCHRCGRFAPGLFGARRFLDWCFAPNFSHARALVSVFVVIYILALRMSIEPSLGGSGFSLDPNNRGAVRLGMLLPWEFTRWEPWRIVTACLLHLNVLHILFNSSSLLVAGPFVETVFGPARFWILFVVTGIAGNLACLPFDRWSFSAGASGAIFGLIGALIAFGVRRGGVHGHRVRDYALKWLAYGAAFSFLPGVNWLAHAGGAVSGLAVGWLLHVPNERSGRESDASRLIALLAIGVVFASLVAMAVWNFKADF